MNAAELRRLQAETRKAIEELEAQLVVLREQETQLGKLADNIEALDVHHGRSILRDDMNASAYAAKARPTGRPSESDHPFPKALEKLKPPVNLRQWAEAHGLTRSKVASWLLDGDGGRRIPRKYADEIEKDFKIPATQGPKGTWKNGIREE